MFDESNESGQLPLPCVEDRDRIIKNIKNSHARTCRYQWLYGSITALCSVLDYSCLFRAREQGMSGYSSTAHNTGQGALITPLPAGINRNSARESGILKGGELVFWRYMRFLVILYPSSRAREE